MTDKARAEALRSKAADCNHRAADLRVTRTETLILSALATILRDLARREEAGSP